MENPRKFTNELLKQGSLAMLLDQSQHPTFNYTSTCWQKGFEEEILEKMPFITSSLKKNTLRDEMSTQKTSQTLLREINDLKTWREINTFMDQKI